MAPTVPKKRPSIRRKSTSISNPSNPTKSASAPSSGADHAPSVYSSFPSTSSTFTNSKKDKRTIKHSTFIHRIEKSHKKPLKRRRPSKKLVTTLEALGDALPSLDDLGSGGGGNVIGSGEGKIKQKSMKSRPGATKRREKLERMERERFGKNMAILVGLKGEVQVQGAGGMAVDGENESEKPAQTQNTTSNRWAALRGFISQTMEQKAEFRKD